MLNFEAIEADLPRLNGAFFEAKPFSHVVIDSFADHARLLSSLRSFPTPGIDRIAKSRDFIFARNKFEKSDFKDLSPDLRELHEDLVSPRFARILRAISEEQVFIDPQFHGGGIHQGGEGSFLDMHADFNYHPLQKNWFRALNILLYLNPEWRPEYGGELKLKDPSQDSVVTVAPIFNRCVIMLSRDFTLHGYDRINFPKGAFRRSIAAYAYLFDEHPTEARTTDWRPENASVFKTRVLSALPVLMRAKHAIFGSGTARNR